LPDPMANPSSVARAAFYGIQAAPGIVIDGAKDVSGGAIREKAALVYDRIRPEIEKRLEMPSNAQLRIEASLEGSTVKVKAIVDRLKGGSQDLKLQIALVEDELHYSGENRIHIHPMVVRSLASGLSTGFALRPSQLNTVQYTFDLTKISAQLKAYLDEYEAAGDFGPMTFKEKKHRIEATNLSVVSFVQNEKTKEVLQAVYIKVNPPPARQADSSKQMGSQQ